MKFKAILFALLPVVLFTTCKDDDEIGASIQPSEDLLTAHASIVNANTNTVLTHSVLSKSDYFYLGKYTDNLFGETKIEFMTQLDARINGLKIPETTVISTSSTTPGIRADLLSEINSEKYGDIISIENPRNVKADSLFFLMQYTDDFFGDESALQNVEIYALNEKLSSTEKYFTDTDIAEYCKKDTLLGTGSYVIGDSREVKITLDNNDLKDRLVKIYQEGSSVNSQEKFNDFLKGVYISYYLNGKGMIKINVAGLLLHYSYDGDINVIDKQNNDAITQIRSEELPVGHNPLVSTIFLSANKAVESIILVSHTGLEEKYTSSIQNQQDFTYTFTPAGLYTRVNIPLDLMMDSIQKVQSDIEKVSFNNASLKMYTKELNWETSLSKTPNSYMLLIPEESIESFFYENNSPDEYSSFLGTYKDGVYTFDLTKAIQKKLSGKEISFNENMVIVPIIIEEANSVNYFRQQLWLTATMFHGPLSEEIQKRPRMDMIFTSRK